MIFRSVKYHTLHSTFLLTLTDSFRKDILTVKRFLFQFMNPCKPFAFSIKSGPCRQKSSNKIHITKNNQKKQSCIPFSQLIKIETKLVLCSIVYRSHSQVVCVPKTNLTPQTLQLINSYPLQCPLSTNRHENRGADGAVWKY